MTLVAGVDSSTQSTKVVVCDAETGEVLRTIEQEPGFTALSLDEKESLWTAAKRSAEAGQAD